MNADNLTCNLWPKEKVSEPYFVGLWDYKFYSDLEQMLYPFLSIEIWFQSKKLTPLRHRCDCAGAENAHKLEWSDYMPQFSGLYRGLAAQKPDADWDTNPHINIPGFRADRRDNLRPAKFHLLQNMKPKYYSQINPLEDLQPESTNKNKCGCFYSVKIHKLVSWSILQSFVMTACENCILVECLRSIFKFSFQVVLFLTTPLNLH